MNIEVSLNPIAVLLATLAGFLVGGLWYSNALFGKVWMRAADMTEERIATANPAKTYGLAFLFLLVMALCLAMFLGSPDVDLAAGAFYGFLTGFGWLFFAIGVVALFEQRPFSYLLVNGGYWVVTMTLMGAIIGGWR